jgi:hypothetical protein
MNQLRRSFAIVAAPFVVAGIFACGEEGQTIGANQCPTLPLYHWQYDAGVGWRRLDKEGNVLSLPSPTDPEYKDLPGGNGRCQTPPGYSVSEVTSAQNTGGAKNTDAGRD